MDSTVETSVVKEKLASLYAYMSRRLKIQQAPKLVLTKNVENANKPFGFTGHYDHRGRSIKVYITNRHTTDILRSFAHEVIHHWQNEHGKLTDNGGDGHYAQQNKNMRIREMEAYLLGNIIFRDWQDTQRYGTPEKEPFLVSLNENLAISDSSKLRDMIKEMIRKMITNNIIVSYHRNLSSGDMRPSDFAEVFEHAISNELEKQIETINNKGNWESQPIST